MKAGSWWAVRMVLPGKVLLLGPNIVHFQSSTEQEGAMIQPAFIVEKEKMAVSQVSHLM